MLGLLLLRILQIILGLVVLGTAGYVARWYNWYTSTISPSEVNFLIFVPLYSFITIAYLEIAPRYAKRASHPYAHFALEVSTTIFYLAGFIALTNFLSKLEFCRGSVCSSARTACVMAAISFVSWIVTSVLLSIEMFKNHFRAVQGNNALRAAMTDKQRNGMEPC